LENDMTSGAVIRTAAVIAVFATPAFAQDAPPARPAITTPGEATITRAPDRAWVTVATDARAGNSGDARRMGAMAMSDVQAALKTTGLAPDAIRTLGFSLQPQVLWTEGKSSVTGFVAHNEIEVRVDDLDKLPAVLDVVTTPKNVSLSIEGPRFDLKDREAIEHDALAAAVANAMSRARAIAEGAKASLGPILSIENETPSSPGPMPLVRGLSMATAGGAPPSTPITPGTIEIRAAVRLTIAIQGTGGGR
jgi:hypothetical protein